MSFDPSKYPLFSALRDRRSRRFGLGMKIPAGPLAHTSRFPASPLSEQEEAALVWAACGITGPALADLCYAPGQGGSIMAGLVGRTVASGDGLQTVSLFALNDRGAWLVRRPQDFAPAELEGLVALGRQGESLELYRRMRVQILDHRAHPPVEPLFNINANRWSLHAAGTSYFLPVGDLTPMYLNSLLEILSGENGVFIVDERAGFRPAGLARFGRRRGGHLEDDPAKGRIITIKQLEQFLTDFVNLEQGMMLQNLALMTQALGLGGFPHFANHEFAWFESLGFQKQEMTTAAYLGVRGLAALGMRVAGRNPIVPLFASLQREGRKVLEALCPPNYPTMRAAVEAFVLRKFGPEGVFRRKPGFSAWQDHGRVAGAVAPPGERAVAATTAYCEYVWKRYGRFPAHVPPFRCGLAHQVARLDLEFYDRFYREGAVSETQRERGAGGKAKC